MKYIERRERENLFLIDWWRWNYKLESQIYQKVQNNHNLPNLFPSNGVLEAKLKLTPSKTNLKCHPMSHEPPQLGQAKNAR